MALAEHGVSARQIACQLRMARGTVLKFLRAKRFPERASCSRPRLSDPYVPYLHERWNAGEHSARVLWRAMRAGLCGQRCARAASRGWVAKVAHGAHAVPNARTSRQSAGRQAGGRLLRGAQNLLAAHEAASDLSASESAYLTALTRRCPHIADAQYLVMSFHRLLTARAPDQLPPWLEQCEHSGIAELVGFAQGLRRDDAAVGAAVRSPWSQGQTEGQVNRLKMLKRQMDGRAGLDLRRRRVLQQQTCAP